MEKFQNYNCPNCHSNGRLFTKGQKGDYLFDSRGKQSGYHDYYICPNCDIIFNQKILNSSQLEQGYRRASLNESHYAAITYKKILDKLKLNKQNCSILDIGCGDGSLLKLLWQNGFKKLTGIDPGVASSNAPIKFYNTSFNKDVFDSKFDFICSFMAMEHLTNPLEICKDCYNLLNNQGIFLITFHDFRYFFNYLFRKYSPIYDHQHLQIFSKKGAANLLTTAGFKVVKTSRFRNSYPINYWLQLLKIKTNLKFNITLDVGNFYILAVK